MEGRRIRVDRNGVALTVRLFAALATDVSSIRRRLVRRPCDFLTPVLTLALVIGVGAAAFAVANAMLIRPLPFPDDHRLVRVFTLPPGVTEMRSRNPLASIDFVRFRERARTLDRLEVIWQRERALTDWEVGTRVL